MRAVLFFSVIMVFSLTLLNPSLPEALMKGLSTYDLTNESDDVIEGDVEDVTSQFSGDGTTIITRVTVRPRETVKGSHGTQPLVVEYEGGEVGDLGLMVSDQSSFEWGERVLLFLKKGKSRVNGDVHEIVGKAQGKYSVGKDGVARKKGFSLAADPERVDHDLPLDELKNKVRKAVR